MTVYDYHAGQNLVPGTHPTPFSQGDTTSFQLKMSADSVVLDVQRAQIATMQMLYGSSSADLLVEISTVDYRKMAPGTLPEYATNPTGNLPVDTEFVQSAPTWYSLGSPATALEKLDLTGIHQVRLTAASKLAVSVVLERTDAQSATWIHNPTAVTPGATLDDVVTAIETSTDTEPTLVQDGPNGSYFYSMWATSADGSTQTLAYFDMTGSPVAAPANPIPVQQQDYEVISNCYEAVNTTADYVLGDKLRRLQFYDMASQSLIFEIWENQTTGANLPTVPFADVTPCGAESPAVHQQWLWDYNADIPTRFLRSYVQDAAANTSMTKDTLADGVTPYNPSGTVQQHKTRQTLGSEILAFNDSAVTPFMAVPVGATWAEYHVWGGDVCMTTSGATPDPAAFAGVRLNDGANAELESSDEVLGFQAIGLPGQSGAIYVEFFNHS